MSIAFKNWSDHNILLSFHYSTLLKLAQILIATRYRSRREAKSWKINEQRQQRSSHRYFSKSRGRIDHRYNTGDSVPTTRSPHRSSLDVQLSVDNALEPRSPTSKNVPRASILLVLEIQRIWFSLSVLLVQDSLANLSRLLFSLRTPSCTQPTATSPTPHNSFLFSRRVSLFLFPSLSPVSLAAVLSFALRGSTYGRSFGNHIFFVSQFAAPCVWMPCLHSDEGASP